MYGKLKNLSIEELEVEIEDLDIEIGRIEKEKEDIDTKMRELRVERNAIYDKLIGLRAISKLCSDLILEKQREEAQ